MIWHLVIKNLKLIFRNSMTIILIVLAPIFLMLVVGLSFSGDSLTNTKVGLVNFGEKNYFANSNIDFVRFNDLNDLTAAFSSCRKELKKGNVELCVHFSPLIVDGEMRSAKVIYGVDSTRGQITQILMNSFDRTLDKVTEDISVTSIEGFFSQANKTLVLMENSSVLIDSFLKDLQLARTSLVTLEIYLDKAIAEFESLKGELDLLKKDLDRSNLEISSMNSDLNNFFEELEEIDDLSSNLNDLSDDISALRVILVSAGYSNEASSLNSLEKDLKVVSGQVDEIEDLKDDFYDNFNTQNSLSNLVENVDENYYRLDEFSKELKSLRSNVVDFSDSLEGKQREMIGVKKLIDENSLFFSDLILRDARDITEPISSEVIPTNNNFEKIHQLAPAVVVIILLFIGLLLSNVVVSLEVNSKAYFRNLISPVPQWNFVTALFLTSFLIIFVQVMFLFMVLTMFFSVPIFSNFMDVFIVVSHILVVFILLGIFLAFVFNSLQLSILVTTFVILFMFLLSNIILPFEIMPPLLSDLVLLNPVVIGEDLLRKIFYHPSLGGVDFSSLIVLYVYMFFLVIMVSYASDKRQKSIH